MENTLRGAIAGLDPEDDGNWTTAGLPSVDAVEAAYGQKVSRADINEAAPGFDRDAAREKAGGVKDADRGLDSGEGDAKPGADGPRRETPIDIAGKAIAGDPSLNNRGGLGERDMESTAERDSRAAAQPSRVADALAGKLDQSGDADPFELMDEFSRITSGPRYKRNQTFAQIRTLWAQAQSGAREYQKRVDTRNAMRADRRAG